MTRTQRGNKVDVPSRDTILSSDPSAFSPTPNLPFILPQAPLHLPCPGSINCQLDIT